jgi:hypothetical protein
LIEVNMTGWLANLRRGRHIAAMLELRPNCELCDCDLPPTSDIARICTYECTFCAPCAKDELQGVCPNCGGNLVPRPIRPRQSWRKGTGLANHPAGTQRQYIKWTDAQWAELSARLKDVPPDQR